MCSGAASCLLLPAQPRVCSVRWRLRLPPTPVPSVRGAPFDPAAAAAAAAAVAGTGVLEESCLTGYGTRLGQAG